MERTILGSSPSPVLSPPLTAPASGLTPERPYTPSPSLQSRFGLNAANFFLAEVVGVVLPFVNDYLQGHKWSYLAIGVATSLAGLGVFLMQTPAGFLVDRLGFAAAFDTFAIVAAIAATLFLFLMPETRSEVLAGAPAAQRGDAAAPAS